jgi:NAD+ kinase
MKLMLFVNERKPDAVEIARRLAASWTEQGLEWGAAGETARCVGSAGTAAYDGDAASWTGVVLGGDGTLLTASRSAPGVPLLAVNLGTVGFLAAVEPAEVDAAVAQVLAGELKIQERSMLSVRVDGGPEALAVNEVVVGRHSSRRTADLAVRVDDELFWRWSCDGVLVATPTGSTAYALSAGGPLVSPDAAVLVVVPICAHTMFDRPLVVPDHAVVDIAPERGVGDDLAVTADGATVATGPATVISVARAEQTLRLVGGPEGRYARLRRKLADWGAMGGRE